jgi:hypothetical protein
MSESTSQSLRPGTKRGGIAAPILITTIGVGWLLTVHGVLPGVQWAWVLSLAMLGVLVLFWGIDKVSAVVGPSLIAGSFLSILRQSGWISIDTEIPLLTIVLGSFWTLAYLLPLPAPTWFVPEPRSRAPVPAASSRPES